MRAARLASPLPYSPRDENRDTHRLHNAPGNPQTVALTGIGTVVSLAPATLNFGSEPVGTKSPPRTVTLTNHGKTTLTISHIGFTGADSTDFGEPNTCGTSVRPGASCAISITFTPRAKGNRRATLDVTDKGGQPSDSGALGVGNVAAARLPSVDNTPVPIVTA